MKFKNIILIALSVLGSSFLTVACGPKDADPEAKVDAPGYYNGPMQPHGAASKASGAALNSKTTG